MESFLNFYQVKEITGLSRSTIWRLEKSEKFPARVKISTNRVGWRKSEVSSWTQFQENWKKAQPNKSKK